MDEEAALLRAICEQPDEDAPRLAFADWLTERGRAEDESWAELIRAQVALALGAGDERERLATRERALVPGVAAFWTAWTKSQGLQWENWTRGFPATLAGPGERIRRAYPTFSGRVPLTELNIRAATDADLLALAGWPEARSVYKLGVWTDTTPITETGFLALIRCAALQQIERFRLDAVRLTDRAAFAFLDSPLCANLRHIKMRLADGLHGLDHDVRQQLRARFGQYDVY